MSFPDTDIAFVAGILACCTLFGIWSLFVKRSLRNRVRFVDAAPLGLPAWLRKHDLATRVEHHGVDVRAFFEDANLKDATIHLIDERGETEIELVGKGETPFAAISALIERYNSVDEPEYVACGYQKLRRKIAPLKAGDL